MYRSFLFPALIFVSLLANAQDNAIITAARLHYDKAQYTNALVVLDAVTENNTTDYKAWQLKGDCYQKEGKFAEAIASYATAENYGDKSALLQANWAAALYNLKKYDEGAQRAKAALKIDKDLPEAHYFMGNLKHQDFNLTAALKHYNQALKLNPDYRDALYMRAATHSELGNYREAVRDYEHVLKLDPNLAQAKYNIGVIQLLTESYAAASKTFSEVNPVLLDKPEDFYFYQAEANYFAGDKEEACALYAKAKDMGDKESAELYQKYCIDKEERKDKAPEKRTIRATF